MKILWILLLALPASFIGGLLQGYIGARAKHYRSYIIMFVWAILTLIFLSI